MNKLSNTILIVDDNTDNIRILAEILTDFDYKIEYAIDGSEALELTRKQEFDLILLDVMMPEMDGFETCRKIKTDSVNRETPVIFITAKTDTESIKKGFESGGIDYISKPFNPEELITRINTQIELRSNRLTLKNLTKWLEQKVEKRTNEITRLNNRLEKNNIELAELELLKIEMINRFCREIEIPLNSLSETIKKINDSKMVESVQVIENQLQKLNDSFSDLKSFSKTLEDVSKTNTITASAKTKSQIKINDLIRRCLENFSNIITEKNISLQINQMTNDKLVKGNGDLMTRALDTIIRNRIQSAPNGSWMGITVKEKMKEMEIEFSDNGPGLSEEMISSFFKPFVNDNKDQQDRFGVDFYLVRNIIRAHSGSINVENKETGGIKISIRLPLDKSGN